MPVPDRDSAEFFVAPGPAGVGRRDAPAGGLVAPVTPVAPDISRCIQRHQILDPALEANSIDKMESLGVTLEVAQDIHMGWEAESFVASLGPALPAFFHRIERKLAKGHQVAGKVGTQSGIHRGMHAISIGIPAQRVRFQIFGINPCAAEAGLGLENHGLESLQRKLARDRKPRRPRADHGYFFRRLHRRSAKRRTPAEIKTLKPEQAISVSIASTQQGGSSVIPIEVSTHATPSESDWAILFASWLLVTTASLGSLFFSEVMELPPCSLCWAQRVFMFPLAIILLRGLLPYDPGVVRYALPLAAIGGLIAFYHLLLQIGVIPESAAPCRQGVSCSEAQLQVLGFVSIPMLSLVVFAMVTGLLWQLKRKQSS